MSASYSFEPIEPAEYQAANGHRMVTIEWTRDGRRVQWNAQHSENCPCSGDEPLPDW